MTVQTVEYHQPNTPEVDPVFDEVACLIALDAQRARQRGEQPIFDQFMAIANDPAHVNHAVASFGYTESGNFFHARYVDEPDAPCVQLAVTQATLDVDKSHVVPTRILPVVSVSNDEAYVDLEYIPGYVPLQRISNGLEAAVMYAREQRRRKSAAQQVSRLVFSRTGSEWRGRGEREPIFSLVANAALHKHTQALEVL